MNGGGFNLRKWRTNDQILQFRINEAEGVNDIIVRQEGPENGQLRFWGSVGILTKIASVLSLGINQVCRVPTIHQEILIASISKDI